MNSRNTALQILLETEKGSYSNLTLDNHLANIEDKRDRALITEMVYGVLRNKNRLDFLIARFSSRLLQELDLLVLVALRLGVYQLEFLDRVPPRAAINETVKAVKGKVNKGATGFVNGLLRNFVRNRESVEFPDPRTEPVRFLEVYYSHPRWILEIWLREYGYEKTEGICKYNNLPGELTIRINSLKYTEDEISRIFKQRDIIMTPNIIPGNYRLQNINNVRELPLFAEGGFMVQGPAATLTSLVLAPAPGSRILDMAAAPGGKTTHLGELMKNQGEIVALDIYEHKVKLLNDNCQRLGIKNVKTCLADGTKFQDKRGFDLVLVDAPCSGLGLIRQKPEIRWNKNKSDLAELVSLQKKLLQNASLLAREGGYILYSTCTLTPQENRGVIDSFLAENKQRFKLVNIAGILDNLGMSALTAYVDDNMLELVPPGSRTEGFFMAKIKKL